MERRLTAAAVNDILQTAVASAGLEHPQEYAAHSLRAGFVTYAHTRGATDHAITHQTRHRSLTSVGTYIRTDTALGLQRRRHPTRPAHTYTDPLQDAGNAYRNPDRERPGPLNPWPSGRA